MAFDPLVVILLLFYLLFVVTLLILWFALKSRPQRGNDQDDVARASPKTKDSRDRAQKTARKTARFAAPKKPEKTNLSRELAVNHQDRDELEQPPVPPREISPTPIVREVVRSPSAWQAARDQEESPSAPLYQPSNDHFRGVNAQRVPAKELEPKPAAPKKQRTPTPPPPAAAESDEEEDAFERFINARNDEY